MTDTPETADDWLSNPAPPPKRLDGLETHATPAEPPPKKPRAKVTPLRPLDQLAGAADAPPIAAAPPSGPPDDPPGPPPEALPPAEPGGRGSHGRPWGEIWEGCPVKPLGVNGATRWYLDVHGQLIPVGKHDIQAILGLFGRQIPQLIHHFPQWAKDPDTGEPSRKPNRFDQNLAAIDMMKACSEKGLFDPEGAVRGVGAWTDDDGQLIYHAGDKLYVGDRIEEPGPYQGRIYPAAPAVPHPAASDKDAPDPVAPLMTALNSWVWTRPDIDPLLALGMIGVQMFGGALDWRPAYWVTAAAGSGKSKFQNLMIHLHGGDKGLIQMENATASGLRSIIGQSTLPIALDELEPDDENSRKEREIIELMRQAASGGRWARGSSDQKGSTGQLRSTFLFSSIIVPGALKSQDLQRIILLSLQKFPDGTPDLPIRSDTWRRRGAQLRRLILDRWPSWAERLELWRAAFVPHGISARDALNWGTTLAMAQMIQSHALPSADELAGWTAKLARLIRASAGEAGDDADEVLTHLMSQEFDVFRRGERFTLAQWIMVAAQSPGAPEALVGSLAGVDTGPEGPRAAAARNANAKLGSVLLRVIVEKDQPARLFIGNKQVQGLLNLFEGTRWARGAWNQSLLRVPGAVVADKRRMAGFQSRGVEVPLASIPGLADLPADRDQTWPQPARPQTAPDGLEDWT